MNSDHISANRAVIDHLDKASEHLSEACSGDIEGLSESDKETVLSICAHATRLAMRAKYMLKHQEMDDQERYEVAKAMTHTADDCVGYMYDFLSMSDTDPPVATNAVRSAVSDLREELEYKSGR